MKIDCTREGDTVAAAKLLLLLPRAKSFKARRAMGFECKTCSKAFPTFQALGGHRTGHTKPKAVAKMVVTKAANDCPLCGMRFLTGQALGGHMRRHKKGGAANSEGEQEEGGGICLELSLSPPGSPLVKCPRDSLGLRLGVEM